MLLFLETVRFIYAIPTVQCTRRVVVRIVNIFHVYSSNVIGLSGDMTFVRFIYTLDDLLL